MNDRTQDRGPEARWPDLAIPAAAALAYLILLLWRLGLPSTPIFDEIFHARGAMQALLGNSTAGWNHPPLTRLLVAAGIWLSGGQFNPVATEFTEHQAAAWRLASATAAALTLPALYALGRSLGLGRGASTLAVGLLAFDGTFFVLGRVAMTNIFAVLFLVVAAVGLWRYLNGCPTPWLALAGAGLGCAVATRWTGLVAWAIALAFVGWRLLRAWSSSRVGLRADLRADLSADLSADRHVPAPRRHLLGESLLAATCLLMLPVAVYLLAYLPMVLSGMSWGKVLELQPAMFASHAGVATDHPFASPWWSWPLLLRPVWFFFGYFKAGIVHAVWAAGNPLVWWPAVPVLVLAAYQGSRTRSSGPLLVAAFGLGLWLFWAIGPRKITFQHYMLESLPFACLALAGALFRLAAWRPALRFLPAVYAVAAALWLVAFRPLLVAEPVPVQVYASRMWLGGQWEFSALVGEFRHRHHLESPEAWKAFMRAHSIGN